MAFVFAWPWPSATLIAAIERRAVALRAYPDLLTAANHFGPGESEEGYRRRRTAALV